MLKFALLDLKTTVGAVQPKRLELEQNYSKHKMLHLGPTKFGMILKLYY